MTIANIVKDWGGFERFVAQLHETGDVKVDHNVVLIGRSGAPRQIDVVIRHRQDLYEHLIIAECKYWNSNVTRDEVDALSISVREVGAARGVIFSTKGFQSGAITQAKHENIDLYVVRDLTAEEWGLPGAVVDLFLQILQPGMGGISCSGATAIGLPPGGHLNFNLAFGSEGPESSTPTLTADGSPGGKDIETYLFEGLKKRMESSTSEFGVFNGGAECTTYVGCPFVLRPNIPFKVSHQGGIVFIPSIEVDAAMKVSQSRITVDRAKNYQFAVALDNLVTGITSTATRPKEASSTEIAQIVTGAETQREEEPVANGSVLRVSIKGFFPYDEIRGLRPVPIETVRRPFVYRPPTLE